MFRTLNETFVDEVNGGQAAVSGKQIRNYGNHRTAFVLNLLGVVQGLFCFPENY